MTLSGSNMAITHEQVIALAERQAARAREAIKTDPDWGREEARGRRDYITALIMLAIAAGAPALERRLQAIYDNINIP